MVLQSQPGRLQDAKDYKRDDGNVIAGTKNATDDDFVTFEEFQLFNIYTCIYAAMFDAFAKIGEWEYWLTCGIP